MSRPQSGFTLLEMLIAMVIIAVVGITISTAIGGVASQTFSLERRSVAHWIGQNQITRLRLSIRAGNPLPKGKDTARVYMGKRDWEVRTQIVATDLPLIQRVEIDVFELVNGDPTGPFEHTVAFVGL